MLRILLNKHGEVSEKTIAVCWLNSDILSRAVQGDLEGVFGKVRGLRKWMMNTMASWLRLLKICVI